MKFSVLTLIHLLQDLNQILEVVIMGMLWLYGNGFLRLNAGYQSYLIPNGNQVKATILLIGIPTLPLLFDLILSILHLEKLFLFLNRTQIQIM